MGQSLKFHSIYFLKKTIIQRLPSYNFKGWNYNLSSRKLARTMCKFSTCHFSKILGFSFDEAR